MKITVERDVMAEAVAWVARSLPNRPSVPILAGLLMRAKGSQLVLSSFDYETSARITIDAQVDEEGEALVSGRLLSEIARSLPNRPARFTANSNHVELVCGSARFTLQMLPVEDYPQLPEMPAESGTVPSDEFTRSVAQVVVAAGRDELLPVFTGVRIEINDDRLSLLATDRYRMALKELTWNPATTQAESAALVPARVLSESARSMGGGEAVALALSNGIEGEGLIGLSGEGAGGRRELTTRLLDGEFPKVRHLMDIKPNVTVRVKTEEVLESVKRVSLVAERNTSVRMVIEDDRIALDAATGDQAQATEAIEAQVNNVAGGEMAVSAVGFNPRYLTDALSALDTPYVQFSFTAPGKPCLVQGLPDVDGEPEADYKHVIMLMRLPG
ncbi:DNA polymerase III subunit beta [Propionibacterium freudenreichii]|uniref:DNA polymerase III subunit beta n=1 Tax=Propionibacterium freudenreichii TaxID=1744 RepID=UPI000BC35359|nr:DNA polymerase III subunit beta [Propionibacterium freudenreichii]MDK9295435.1 DNA polymerase III subunit beta [Propionibacterium freudenreichii]MDK9360825.1 DNA polymerase III subunit beta [Propionibacterium freudenreichii]MDK9640000.1 DNA polymerase III subunit beta [Propionibacterium freudenreichii]MDK9659184.1 DNA polymerase III subunit beta [Propionibacterium freudenreichii]WGU90396.1 DNA polymerase III subunit beta [Propionibacterium freudenreichii]